MMTFIDNTGASSVPSVVNKHIHLIDVFLNKPQKLVNTFSYMKNTKKSDKLREGQLAAVIKYLQGRATESSGEYHWTYSNNN